MAFRCSICPSGGTLGILWCGKEGTGRHGTNYEVDVMNWVQVMRSCSYLYWYCIQRAPRIFDALCTAHGPLVSAISAFVVS